MNKEIRVNKVNRVIQVRKVFLLLILAFSLLVCGCGNKDSKAGQEIFQKSCEAMKKIESAASKVELNITMPNKNYTASMLLHTSIIIEPEIMHFDMNEDINGVKFSVERYACVENDKYIEYVFPKLMFGKWLKYEIPLDRQQRDRMLNPVKSMDDFKKALIDVKVVGEDETIPQGKETILELTMKPEVISEWIIPSITDIGSDPFVTQIEAKKLLYSLNEVKHKVWISEDNLLVSKIEYDLGDILKKLAKNKEASSELKEAYKNASGKVVILFYKYDQVEEIVIPDEVKNCAVAR